MKTNTSSTKAVISNKITPFITLKIDEKRLILINKKEEEFGILFSELDKIFIKRCQLSFFLKVGITLTSLFIISVLANYLLIEIVLFASLLFVIPLLLWMNNYKWYQLNLRLNDGTFYSKTFYKEKKQEQITLVNVVKKEIYDNHIRSNFRNEKGSVADLVEVSNSLSTLSIA
jgi:hypothetical protein